MHERVRFIDHQGKKILLVDLSNCPANEVEEVARAVPDYVTVNPRDSVLVLTDFTGAVFDRDAVRAVKETAVFDKPFVKRSALIRTEDLPASFYDELKSFPGGNCWFSKPARKLWTGWRQIRWTLEPTPRSKRGLAEGEALTVEPRKAASTTRLESKGGQVSCPPEIASSGPI